jgi:hypothetical protein
VKDRYLLDTNVISEFRKAKPHGAVVAWLASLSVEQLVLPAVVIAEIQDGAEITRRQYPVKAREIEIWLDEIMASFSILPMDGQVFREWSRFMAGRSPDLAEDAMIAATARVYDLTVATRNVKDFEAFAVRVLNPFSFSAEAKI